MISSIYFPPPKAPAHSTCVQQSRTSRRTALVLYVVEIVIVFIMGPLLLLLSTADPTFDFPTSFCTF